MYSRLHKATENVELTEEYKTYRNTLNRILRLAKRNYYYQVLNENKSDLKKVWNVVNELTYNKKRCNVGPSQATTAAGDTVSDPQKIAEEFNNFFVNISKSMAYSISRDNSIISRTSSKRSNTFLFPSSPKEVFNVIKAFNENKARRTLDVETEFLKVANPIILNYLSVLFNSYFS